MWVEGREEGKGKYLDGKRPGREWGLRKCWYDE